MFIAQTTRDFKPIFQGLWVQVGEEEEGVEAETGAKHGVRKHGAEKGGGVTAEGRGSLLRTRKRRDHLINLLLIPPIPVLQRTQRPLILILLLPKPFVNTARLRTVTV